MNYTDCDRIVDRQMKVLRTVLLFALLILSLSSNANPVNAADNALVTGTISPTQPTSAPSSTFTPTSSPTLTPTTTLMPLPALTLIFPAQTSTSLPTDTPEPVINQDKANSTIEGDVINLSPRLRILVVILVVLWVLLIGFAIGFIRQFK